MEPQAPESEEMPYEGSPLQLIDKLRKKVQELKCVNEKMRVKMRNQRKHLRWFNRLYNAHSGNLSMKLGKRMGVCDKIDRLEAFLRDRLDRMEVDATEHHKNSPSGDNLFNDGWGRA